MRNKRKWLVPIAAVLLTILMATSVFAPLLSATDDRVDYGQSPNINLIDTPINLNNSQFYDGTKVMKLPSSVKDTDEISLIIEIGGPTLLDTYDDERSEMSFTEYYLTAEAIANREAVAKKSDELMAKLDKMGISYLEGKDYDTVLSGFEIIVKAGDFLSVCNTLGDSVNVIVGEVYETEETELVENRVNVYETGIFNSKDFGYDGTGMVVAVLDTGLDYTHTAFSMGNFTASPEDWGLTFEQVSALIGATAASGRVPGISAEDVYISGKVPYGFDYADNDTEVFPINSDHGTHVAGVIAGKDDTITGVAPNAQIVVMKIFSDLESTSRTSWILGAVEDCVVLGVDVINMSIGTACGFSRETDKEAVSGVYDRVREEGISLVVAASNSYNSTYGSEKNGNLGLTSNPDSSTVGSPSTYLGALSVASIEGVKTPYILYGDTIIYFEESTNRVSEEKVFLDDLIKQGITETEIEYVTIPGVGRMADYSGIDIEGKIALVSRGSTTFEEKANTAQKMGAAGIIIYNNVSGEIKMNVGDTTIAVCSISQDDGELLAAHETGTIKVSVTQTSGPFMSDFSSWGPTPDLQIKPEITAHGGSILSAVPGQDYDRISGTSMATPNISGAVALLRQYVEENFPEIANDPVEVTAVVNRLMMSTADIILNKNGLPYSVRKQGAGLANLINSRDTGAYILTYDRKDGSVMDKTKIELGDDPAKTGVYVLKFTVDNFGNTAVSYDLSAYVLTEGVSETLTNQGETTVTETAYLLDGAKVEITSVVGGTQNGSSISVEAGKKADVTVTITLSDEDKKYLDDNFENGMYVEGFVILDSKEESTVDLSVPYLAFYGDWSVAPLFDLDYFETDKDAMDDSIDPLDKTMADAISSKPIGGISGDYVSYLGSYYYEQDPNSKLISADRKYISLTTDENGINSLRFVWAGMLRNAERIEITIVEDSTGEVVYSTTDYDIRKSYGDGGSIYPANVDIEFSAIKNNLKNNTHYTVTLKGYLDWDNDGSETNLNNVMTFPLVTDFEAPTLTGCEFYTEYDKSSKTNRLYAKLAVYDNHYSMSSLFGYVGLEYNNAEAAYEYVFKNFDHYQKQIYSEYNSVSYIVYELTDHIDQIKANGTSFAVALTDYALNQAIYDIELPTEFLDIAFKESSLTLSPNQTYDLAGNLEVYPGSEWAEMINYTTTNSKVVRVVGGKLLAVGSGKAKVYANVTIDGNLVQTSMEVTVLAKGDAGYKRIDPPVAESFYLVGYDVNKAFYFLNSTDRKIGSTGDSRKFPSQNYSLSMYPSESVTINYSLTAYFPDVTTVEYSSSNSSIVTVDKNTGKIVAVSEGFATITAKVLMNGKSTYYSKSISIEVKDPYVTSGPSLTSYYGNGGYVSIPESLAITSIGQYAFSNYDYYDKDPADVTEENPEYTQIGYIGENTITEIVIPEGVESIGPYAFANLTALTKVTLPSTLKIIDMGAFYNCTSLTTIVGLENVKFINQYAFANCNIGGAKNSGDLKFDNAVAIADYAFFGNPKIKSIELAKSTQSIGAYAFANNTGLTEVTVFAEKLKLGQFVFNNCSSLTSIDINAQVIPTGAFNNCSSLRDVTIGKDVALIGEYAFRGTAVTSFVVEDGNNYLYPVDNKPYLISADGSTLLLVAPAIDGAFAIASDETVRITSIAAGAFSGNDRITSVTLSDATSVGAYAFAQCRSLASITLGSLTEIGDHAFEGTAITSHPSFAGVARIGSYAFAKTPLTAVEIPDGVIVGDFAFDECGIWKPTTIYNNATGRYETAKTQDGETVYECTSGTIESIIIGDGVKLGAFAFSFNYAGDVWKISQGNDGGVNYYYYDYESKLTTLTIGDNVVIGDYAFYGASDLTSVTIGEGAVIGSYAFYNAMKLADIDLSDVVSIGDYAFSGHLLYKYRGINMYGYLTGELLDNDGSPYLLYCSAPLAKIDLSALNYMGQEAFSHSALLSKVTLGENLKELPVGAFNNCLSLTDINLNNLEIIREYALQYAPLAHVDLSSCVSIGNYAFLWCENLVSVTLGDNIEKVGEGSFSYCESLRTVNGMANVKEIGSYAFAYTDLRSADLTSCEKIGSHAFMKEHLTSFELTLGENLADIGDNPFAYCRINRFYTTTSESFNGVTYESTVYTFDLGENVRIIDGSVYRVVPYGLELVMYCGNEKVVRVADGTVRIGALAFAGSSLESVVLPHTVEAIGHKAFFDCENLALVNFSSYYAPILEEEYDMYYYTSGDGYDNFAGILEDTGTGMVYGLGIVDYYMWTGSSMNNYFYGANFKDHIGHIGSKMIMVRPTNGKNYDTFIYDQYFITVLDGAAAADDITLEAIKLIGNLPEKVSLSDKALVEAARAAYDRIVNNEQRALVASIYSVLTDAEKRIITLEYLENENNNPTPDEPDDDNVDVGDVDTGKLTPIAIVGIILGGLVAICCVAVGALYIARFLISKKRACDADNTAGVREDNGEDDASEDEN